MQGEPRRRWATGHCPTGALPRSRTPQTIALDPPDVQSWGLDHRRQQAEHDLGSSAALRPPPPSAQPSVQQNTSSRPSTLQLAPKNLMYALTRFPDHCFPSHGQSLRRTAVPFLLAKPTPVDHRGTLLPCGDWLASFPAFTFFCLSGLTRSELEVFPPTLHVVT